MWDRLEHTIYSVCPNSKQQELYKIQHSTKYQQTKTNNSNVNMNFSKAGFHHDNEKIKVEEKLKCESTTPSNICNLTNKVRAYCRKAITKQNNTEHFRHTVDHIIVISLFVFSFAFSFFYRALPISFYFSSSSVYLLTLFTFVNYWWSLSPACMLWLLDLSAFYDEACFYSTKFNPFRRMLFENLLEFVILYKLVVDRFSFVKLFC